jgi:DNA repair protein RecO (recombination protein O)
MVRPEELRQGMMLTGYFLRRHVYEPRGLAEPEERAAFFLALEKA